MAQAKETQPKTDTGSVPSKGGAQSMPSFPAMLAQFRRVMGTQLNTFVAAFVDQHTDEQINKFLPKEVADVDNWLDNHMSAFTENEQPSVEDMIDALGTLYMMAFMERLYTHCGLEELPADDGADTDDDSEEG